MSVGKKRPSAAMVIAVIALIAAISGTAYAALPINSVGSRQIKAGAVTTSKIAESAVNAEKVANGSLNGADVNVNELGVVPSAKDAVNAGNVNTVDGHPSACPSGATLIRGLCFDSSPSGPITGVQNAADACAARGGYLPTVEQLDSARNVLNLGNGEGPHSQFTDSYYANTTGTNYSTIVVNATDQKEVRAVNEAKELVGTYEYTCVYNLVR